ncbi:hypothetical protein C6A85_63380, partial [Mycobacterium sp. ITM-2017-0098]
MVDTQHDPDGTPPTPKRTMCLRLALFAVVLSVLFYLTAIERVIDVAYVRGLIESTGALAPLV